MTKNRTLLRWMDGQNEMVGLFVKYGRINHKDMIYVNWVDADENEVEEWIDKKVIQGIVF